MPSNTIIVNLPRGADGPRVHPLSRHIDVQKDILRLRPDGIVQKRAHEVEHGVRNIASYIFAHHFFAMGGGRPVGNGPDLTTRAYMAMLYR